MLSQKPLDKIIVIDFDATLCGWKFPDVGPPEPNVKEALETFKELGYKIHIHSCRTATYWGETRQDRQHHIDCIRQFMLTNDLPYDKIILEMDKPIAEYYIDDRAIRYENNWLEIIERVKSG